MNTEIVEQLETKLAFLERSVAELSDVVYKQQLDIAGLNERLAVLSNRFEAYRTADREYTAEEERPPHY
jgi:SlyX protein